MTRLKQWTLALGWKGWRDHVAILGPACNGGLVEQWDDDTLRVRVELIDGGGRAAMGRGRLMYVHVPAIQARALAVALTAALAKIDTTR